MLVKNFNINNESCPLTFVGDKFGLSYDKVGCESRHIYNFDKTYVKHVNGDISLYGIRVMDMREKIGAFIEHNFVPNKEYPLSCLTCRFNGVPVVNIYKALDDLGVDYEVKMLTHEYNGTKSDLLYDITQNTKNSSTISKLECIKAIDKYFNNFREIKDSKTITFYEI